MDDRFNCICLKCGKRWFSIKLYLTGVPPATCPACHRYDWMKPRVRGPRKAKEKRKGKRKGGRKVHRKKMKK